MMHRKLPGKLLEIHCNALLFSDPREKVLILYKRRGQSWVILVEKVTWVLRDKIFEIKCLCHLIGSTLDIFLMLYGPENKLLHHSSIYLDKVLRNLISYFFLLSWCDIFI